MFVIHHFGRWLKLPVGNVAVDHLPSWDPVTGFESKVENMFDDNLNTHWMPIEVSFTLLYFGGSVDCYGKAVILKFNE